MNCPSCGGEVNTTTAKVIDSRAVNGGIRRRRECLKCGEKFTTIETIAVVPGMRGRGLSTKSAAMAEQASRQEMERLADEARRLADSVDRIVRPERAATSVMLAGLQL